MREESERIRIIDDNTPFGVREAYRLIRANLQFICNHEGSKVICITSSVAHEGKSTISYNLSSVIAEGGSKVLMIDADMRASNIQESLGLRTRYGLSDILAGKLGLENYSEAVKEMDDKGMLNVMVCGKYPPNPSELLASTRMKDLLDRLKKEYDVIIIDGTPLCMVSDILSLSPIIDGYVLVA